MEYGIEGQGHGACNATFIGLCTDAPAVRQANCQLPNDPVRTGRHVCVVEAMSVFTYQALRAANDLEVGGGGRGDIHKITAASVMFAPQTMNKVFNEAVQIHGGTGYIWEYKVNQLFRATKLLEIGAVTVEVRKIMISSEMMR